MRGLPKLFLFAAISAIFLTISLNAGAAGERDSSASVVFDRFLKQNYALEESLAKKHHVEIPEQVRHFFAAVEKRDWASSSNLFDSIADSRRSSGTNWLPEFWGAIQDTYGTYELFRIMDPKFFEMFGVDVAKSIAPGSIYFGGTDNGRFLVSAYSESHSEGRPFFTLTQNALADPAYLDYLQDIYGGKIILPGTNDSQKCIGDYMTNVQARLRHDQEHPNAPREVKPGEDVHLNSSGQVQVSGYVSVMEINGRLARFIFEKNPTNQFFVEESFPLDWMFPNLTPSGLILKLNREPVPQLTEDILKRDHEFWTDYIDRLIGNWISYDTSVQDIAAFAEKVYLRHDFSDFHGDVRFVRDEESPKAFSKLRSSIGGVYLFRLGQPPSGGITPTEYVVVGKNRKNVEREADFAFKQAVALCPSSPEAVYRYVQLLVNLRRVDDALLVAQTAAKLDPSNSQLGYLITNLNNMRSQMPENPQG